MYVRIKKENKTKTLALCRSYNDQESPWSHIED